MECACKWSRAEASLVFPGCVVALQEIHLSDVFGDFAGLGLGQIRQHNNRQLIIDVAGDCTLESLPGAVVADQAMTMALADEPAETIAALIHLPVLELSGCPHLVE